MTQGKLYLLRRYSLEAAGEDPGTLQPQRKADTVKHNVLPLYPQVLGRVPRQAQSCIPLHLDWGPQRPL
jgi:hypothetical protein